VLPLAVEVADTLAKGGVSCGLFSCHTVKPLDQKTLSTVFGHSQLVVTLEEHSELGGFGGSVAEWLADQAGQCARLLRVGTSDAFLYEAAEQEYARERYGLTVPSIIGRITKRLDVGCQA